MMQKTWRWGVGGVLFILEQLAGMNQGAECQSQYCHDRDRDFKRF